MSHHFTRYTFHMSFRSYERRILCKPATCLRHKKKKKCPDRTYRAPGCARTFLFSSPFVAYTHARRNSVRISRTAESLSSEKTSLTFFYTPLALFQSASNYQALYSASFIAWFLSIDVVSRIMHRDALDSFLTLPCNVSQSSNQGDINCCLTMERQIIPST